MRIGSQPPKRLLPKPTQPSKLETVFTSKINNQANGILKWRPGYQIVRIEHNGHYIHIENQATGKILSCNVTDIILEPPVEFWNINTQFGRASCYINHPSNLPTIQLTDHHKLMKHTCSFSCINLNSHLHYSLVLTFTPTSSSSQPEPGESVIFQPVLQAYPTRHSWIVTAHISLGNLECHWKLFKRQLTRTQQFLRSLGTNTRQHPHNSSQHFSWNCPTYRIYTHPVKPTITSAINLLNSNQPQPITSLQKKPITFLGNCT